MDLRKSKVSLSLVKALNKAKKQGADIKAIHHQCLIIIQTKGPQTIYGLLKEFRKLGVTYGYKQMFGTLNYLKTKGLVNSYPYEITPSGLSLLYYIEEQLRKIRLDK